MAEHKLTVEEILELYEDCNKVYQGSGLLNQFEDDQLLYELDFKNLLNLPEEFKEHGVVLPTARDMVDTCVDHTDISNARIFVNRKGTSNISAEEAEMMRKFYLGLIHRTNVEASISPWRVGAKHYWLHGLAVFKTVWDADRWTDKPKQNKGETEEAYATRIDEWRADNSLSLPIVIQAVHPQNIMPDPYEGGRRFIFEVGEKLVYDTQRKYPHWGNPQGKKVSEKVKCISFWTPKYRCELYDNEPVLRVRGGVAQHSYGFLPYVLIDTGLGNLSPDNNLKMRYVGVLRHIRDTLISESRDYSISDIVLARNAWTWFTIEGDNAEQVATISQRFGEVTKLPPGTKVVPQVSQVPPRDLIDHLERTANYIAAHAAPNAVRGMGETGVRSGADRRLVIAEASARYRYSTDAFKYGTAKVLTNCARIMKNIIPGDIRVWARTPSDEFDMKIDKAKMKEPFTCYVEFAPISEEDEYRRHDDLERLVQQGIVTRRWARTQMSNVDPMAMELQEEVERLRADPVIQQLMSQYLSARMMEALNKRSMVESLENPPPPIQGAPPTPQGEQGEMGMEQAGRRMMPPVPNMAPLGSAGNLQNQLQGLRSPLSVTGTQGLGGGGNRP